MKTILMFTIIAVNSIVELVHIISCFEKTNEYFINILQLQYV